MKTGLLLLSSILISSLIHAQITAGLTASYTFDAGTANDDKGTNNGTVYGATLTEDRFGNTNSAYNFINGDYITLPNAPELKSPIMTVSMWVKIDSIAASNIGTNYIYTIINNPSAAYFATFGMTLNASNGTYFSVTQDNWQESVYGSSTNSNTADWQHYVLSMDNDSLKMYIDGNKEWAILKGFTSDFTTDLIYIGTSGSTFTGNLNGSVDDINIFDRVLTDAEVVQMFNAENPIIAGLDENLQVEQTVSIYPNPAINESVNIFSSVGWNEIKIYNVNGQLAKSIQKPNFVDNELQINNLNTSPQLNNINSSFNTDTFNIKISAIVLLLLVVTGITIFIFSCIFYHGFSIFSYDFFSSVRGLRHFGEINFAVKRPPNQIQDALIPISSIAYL